MDKLSYALGLNIGQQLLEMGLRGSLSIDDYSTALRDVLEGRAAQMSPDEATSILQDFFSQLEERRQAEAAERGKAAKEEGEAFLRENAKRPSVHVCPSGLQYEVLTEGSARRPKASDTVSCHYEGRLIDGTVFDSSYRRGAPASFGLRQVIAGWTEGLQLMGEGAKYRFFIPFSLAYGERGAGADIPPFSALIFDVELLKVL